MNKKQIYRWIDTSFLAKQNNNTGRIDWSKSIGAKLPFVYGDISGEVEILDTINKTHLLVYIEGYTSKNGYKLTKSSLVKVLFGDIFKKVIAYEFPTYIQYFVDQQDAYIYTKGSHKMVEVQCPYCGNKQHIEIQRLIKILNNDGNFCKKCSDKISYPEKFMRSILEQLHIDYIPQYNPIWIKPRKYDFYFEVNNKRIIVEMDGGIGHGNPNKIGCLTPEQSKLIDEYKDKMANKHGIQVIRINCNYKRLDSRFQFIKNNIIQSDLSKILDLYSVDFDICNKFTTSSLLLQACEYWHDPNYSIGRIARELKLSPRTIRDYLKIGNELGICHYNVGNIDKNISQNNAKSIDVYKNGQFVGHFESIRKCSQMSLVLFGVQLKHSKISAVCKCQAKSHKGYTFQYADENDNIKLLETEVA